MSIPTVMIVKNGEVIKYKEETVELEDVVKSLKGNGIEVYYKELTTEDIVQTNIKVVKVIANAFNLFDWFNISCEFWQTVFNWFSYDWVWDNNTVG